ncbi:MAG: ATP-binding protein [Thermoanaerobaculaceae bacterium]|nr:ATP-binding protein [Thermoanaerobaculaceae bacterium]TAM56118.1 MAG: HAMP domain-containing protein [Acidobacteriota bacterium]
MAAVALAFAWRRLPRRAPWLAGVALVALLLDALLPAGRSSADFAALANARSAELQGRLAALAGDPRLHRLLYPGGGEAEPEAPFPLVAEGWRSLPFRVDTLVVVDEHGLPVAWAGTAARLPVHLRPLGERAVAAEPGIGSVWLWWRESVFESGRSLGAVLAGVEIPERGTGRVLGVWAGRAAVAAAHLEGWGPGLSPGPAPAMGFVVRPVRAAPWSAPGLAVLVAALVLVVGGPAWAVVAVAAAVVAGLPLLGWLPIGWWLVGAVAACALAVSDVPRGRLWRSAVAVGVGAAAWALAGAFDRLGIAGLPPSLVWPGAMRWALVAALAVLLRNAGKGRGAVPWPLGLASWLPLAVGVARADPILLALGVAAVVLFGLTGRGLLLPALAAAGIVMGAGDAARRTGLVATTEATLARLENVQAPARALLAALPEARLTRMVRLDPGERLVVLGRLATRVGLRQALPGASLDLTDPSGEPAGSWGGPAIETEGRPQELATRALRGGWQLAVLAPPPPHDLLAGLGAAGVAAPVAVFDRSGAPTSRGATFRPLSPSVVGRALAAGRGWLRVGVGEREFQAYFHARRDAVLVVPWVRAPEAEAGLMVAGLTLWGLFPLTLWERRRRWLAWWAQRRTFGGRMRVLSVAAAVLPVLLLGQLLPQQWDRQQEKARLEFARAVSQLLATERWQEGTSWLVRELGGAVVVYRSGKLVSSTRPDLAALGQIPWMPPPEAYVRSIRGWQEPVVVSSGEETAVFAPMRGGEPVVVGVVGLRLQALGRSPSPGEWFAITGVLAMLVALGMAERLGQRLGKPLRRLVAAAHRLERGEPVAGLDTHGDEDVAALGHAFSTMAHEVQRREEELRRGRNFLETVLETLSAAVVAADGDGRVNLANPAARRLLGETGTIPALAARFAPEIAHLAARAGAGERVEGTVHPAASPEALWRVTALPLPGGGARVLVVMEDLSELARAERLSSFAELARIAAHEVKNPLTPIRLWAEELKAALAQGPAAVVAVAQVAAPQILERVEHLREVAQGFSNLVALEHWEPQPIALKALAGEVIAEYEVLRQRGVAIRLAGDDDAVIVADVQWVRRALRHLLENSTRVLAGREGAIEVRVQRLDRQVALAVRDTGGGVATELLGRLFEPHFSTTSEGSGLGLAVVRRVAVRAGGSVEAGNVGAGLEVRILFPAGA